MKSMLRELRLEQVLKVTLVELSISVPEKSKLAGLIINYYFSFFSFYVVYSPSKLGSQCVYGIPVLSNSNPRTAEIHGPVFRAITPTTQYSTILDRMDAFLLLCLVCDSYYLLVLLLYLGRLPIYRNDIHPHNLINWKGAAYRCVETRPIGLIDYLYRRFGNGRKVGRLHLKCDLNIRRTFLSRSTG